MIHHFLLLIYMLIDYNCLNIIGYAITVAGTFEQIITGFRSILMTQVL